MSRGASQTAAAGRSAQPSGEREPIGDVQEIATIAVALYVDGEQSLLILLSEDGLINRMGNVSIDQIERQLFIATIDPGLFKQLRSQVTAGVVHFLGQRLAAPEPKGRLCELRVIFKYSDGREAGQTWSYGSESQGPHPEVCAFVAAAARLTEPWFQQQKQIDRHNTRET
jgi:hypothetical protein